MTWFEKHHTPLTPGMPSCQWEMIHLIMYPTGMPIKDVTYHVLGHTSIVKRPTPFSLHACY